MCTLTGRLDLSSRGPKRRASRARAPTEAVRRMRGRMLSVSKPQNDSTFPEPPSYTPDACRCPYRA